MNRAAAKGFLCLLLAAGTAHDLAAVPHELTAADLEAFLDGLMPLQLAREDVAGAVVAVVKDGQVLLAKGYGYADVKARRPVAADATLFRPGSVSKLFTWTAVMQQVEQGKLDLDRDVNAYLDFQIPATYPRPITLRHLMTHTPGFEEAVKDLFVGDPRALPPLARYLPAHVPKRIFPPGSTPAYSNYGAALAGYLVERASGRPFADYVEEAIFRPLGMTRSTFRQPLPPALAPSMSQGYGLASGEPKPFELVCPQPAGSMSSTGADMTRFMLAHLHEGALGSARILRPETVRQMHARQAGWPAGANAMALGFYEETSHGHRILGHAGDTNWFHSDLHLIPDAGVGFFVSYNSASRADASPRTALWLKFLDRYFPQDVPPAPALADADAQARAVTGTYMVSRRGESLLLPLLSRAGESKVTAQKDGVITVGGLNDLNGQPKRWRAIAPLTFREEGGDGRLVFRRDPLGRFAMAIPYPFFVFHRVAALESQGVFVVLLVGTAGVLLLTVLLWPVAALVRRHYRRPLELGPRERRLRLAIRLAAVLDLAAIAGWGALLVAGLGDVAAFSAPLDPWLRLLQVLTLLGVVGAIVAVVQAVRVWTRQEFGIWARLRESLIALACLGFVWLAWIGKLLSLRLHY